MPNGIPRLGWYVASLALFALALQVATGLLLMLHFRPGAGAWDSVAHITGRVPFGWLVRGLHALASQLLVALGLAHAVASFVSRAYKKPRELTWVSGVGAITVVLGLAATGAALPADREATVVARIGGHLIAAVPGIGRSLASMVGGTDGGTDAMHRFFALHVGILPAILLMLAAAHVLLVRAHGPSAPVTGQDLPWFPDFFRREIALWVVALNAMAAAVALAPPELLPRGDALEPTADGSRPAWFFMAAFQLVRLLPARAAGLRGDQLAVIAGLLSLALVIFLPFWGSSDRRASRVAVTSLAAAWLATLAILTLWGYVAS